MAEPTHIDGGLLPPAPGSPGSGGLIPVTRRLVSWENGVPVVKDVPMFAPAQIAEIGAAAVAQPYSEPGDELAIEMGMAPSEFYGMTLMEVMLIKQAREAARTGDKDQVEAILDRRLGKPKTTAEVHSVSETYEQALARIAKTAAQKAKPVNAHIIDAEIEDLL